MCEAVLISQKPPEPSARVCAVISLRWVWPLTQAISRGWLSRYAVTSSPSTRGFGSPPVATNGLVIVALVWWLNTITALPVGRLDRRLQPGELGRVERAVGVAVGVHGVHHDEPEAALVEGVVGRVRVAGWPGEAVARGQPRGVEVLVDDLAAA